MSDEVMVSTTPEIPCHRTVRYVRAVAAIDAQSGRVAANKTEDAYGAAVSELRRFASSLGANAIVGFSVQLTSASAGGVMGDAIVALAVGTAVVVEPEP